MLSLVMPVFYSLLGKPFAVPYGTPSFRAVILISEPKKAILLITVASLALQKPLLPFGSSRTPITAMYWRLAFWFLCSTVAEPEVQVSFVVSLSDQIIYGSVFLQNFCPIVRAHKNLGKTPFWLDANFQYMTVKVTSK